MQIIKINAFFKLRLGCFINPEYFCVKPRAFIFHTAAGIAPAKIRYKLISTQYIPQHGLHPVWPEYFVRNFMFRRTGNKNCTNKKKIKLISSHPFISRNICNIQFHKNIPYTIFQSRVRLAEYFYQFIAFTLEEKLHQH